MKCNFLVSHICSFTFMFLLFFYDYIYFDDDDDHILNYSWGVYSHYTFISYIHTYLHTKYGFIHIYYTYLRANVDYYLVIVRKEKNKTEIVHKANFLVEYILQNYKKYTKYIALANHHNKKILNTYGWAQDCFAFKLGSLYTASWATIHFRTWHIVRKCDSSKTKILLNQPFVVAKFCMDLEMAIDS